MKGLHIIYKISDFAVVVETLNTLVNMKSPDRVLKSSKNVQTMSSVHCWSVLAVK